ncbi:MAG: hypothetical protein KJ957_03500 [Candidatus Omnitrophica bacterium]|nr:hypothetical protein [Candidatus Omnitrophota bacterium]MBU1853092.1 hypothetical protein [Candidatus Omnitrophota bacterium]
MKNPYNSSKKIYYILLVITCVIIIFASVSIKREAIGAPEYDVSIGNKDALKAYIGDLSLIMMEVDIMLRTLGSTTLSLKTFKESIKGMDVYITKIERMQYPEVMSRLHKMVLLSFKKFRMGFLMFSIEERDIGARLFKSARYLLKYAADDMVSIVEKEGWRVENKTEE